MAPLTRRSRGQLILLTGLVLATVLVVLVLLLNTAIYTENLATRGADAPGSEVIEFRETADAGVGGLIEEENWNLDSDLESRKASVQHGVDNISKVLSDQRLQSGSAVKISVAEDEEITEGRLVIHDDPEESFTSNLDTETWTLSESTDGVRAFSMTVNRTSLNTTTNETADTAFHVRVTNGDDAWRTYVYEDGDNISVATNATTESEPIERCSVEAAEATIDFTGGTITDEAGEWRCPGLEWAESVDPDYELEFVNGDKARGTYNLTVNTEVSLDEAVSDLTGDQPYYVEAIYDVTVEIRYRSPQLTYETEIRVAPGEPDA